MDKPFNAGSIHGAQRSDGSIIAFDYERQMWIDTSDKADRDVTRPAGSASNPLRELGEL